MSALVDVAPAAPVTPIAPSAAPAVKYATTMAMTARRISPKTPHWL
jgi:hypothetical protein